MARIKIITIDPNNAAHKKMFKQLPYEVYADIPQWVPPLSFEATRIFKRRSFAFYKHGEAAFFLAVDNERPVGRISVLNNHAYNQYNQERTAFFYLFECINDRSVTSMLFEKAFNWARERGLNRMEGPKGFTVLDGMGLLVKGFEHRPAFGIPYNPPYYPALLEEVGFSALREVVSGYLNKDLQFPEKIIQVAEILTQKRGFRVLDLHSRSDLRRAVKQLKGLYNAALLGTSGNAPLSDQDLNSMVRGLLWISDPKLIKIIFKDDDPAGFLLSYPDISAAIQRCKGHLLPLGWLYLLKEKKTTKWVNINGAGVIDKYRRLGATALLFTEIYRSIASGQYEHADIVQIGTENLNMQLELQKIGVDFYKTHKTYEIGL